MTPALLTAILCVSLLASALCGPWLLRRAAPALMRVPRLAVVLLLGGMAVWLGPLLALGPVLAWVVTGPAVLPQRAAGVCRQCLAAANPFSTATVDTVVPGALLLGLPAVALAVLGVGLAGELLRQRGASRRTAATLLHGAVRRSVLGHRVWVVEEDRPFALTLPARHGGIALSAGALRALDDLELAAVLAHEEAHLRQRHHLAAAVAAALARHLRWVPLIAAAADAVPHYLEIAADQQARRRAGTTALVGALLKLGEPAPPPGGAGRRPRCCTSPVRDASDTSSPPGPVRRGHCRRSRSSPS